MGGRGSTRWRAVRGDYVPALALHEVTGIAMRTLTRVVRPERGRRLQGRLQGSPIGPIDLTFDGTSSPVTVQLRFCERLRVAGLPIPNDTTVWVLPTQPTFGGARWWFVCPACGRRCEAIYMLPWEYDRRHHGMVWACRCCQGLVYISQREGKGDRALRRLRKVLHQAGAAWTPDLIPRHRPKGMHRRTFARLKAEAGQALVVAAGSGRMAARSLRTGALWVS
jgi:hypothetical protein